MYSCAFVGRSVTDSGIGFGFDQMMSDRRYQPSAWSAIATIHGNADNQDMRVMGGFRNFYSNTIEILISAIEARLQHEDVSWSISDRIGAPGRSLRNEADLADIIGKRMVVRGAITRIAAMIFFDLPMRGTWPALVASVSLCDRPRFKARPKRAIKQSTPIGRNRPQAQVLALQPEGYSSRFRFAAPSRPMSGRVMR